MTPHYTKHPVLLIHTGTRDSIIAEGILNQERIAHDVIESTQALQRGYHGIAVFPTLFLGWNKFEGLDAIADGVCTPPQL